MFGFEKLKVRPRDQAFATRWMWSYNHERPNMALGDSNHFIRLIYLYFLDKLRNRHAVNLKRT